MSGQLIDILEQYFTAKMSGVHTAMPGRVESYNAKEKRVTVKPLLNRRLEAQHSTIEYPVLDNVPVAFLGTKKTVFQFPLARGDLGLILFAESAMDEWLRGDGSPKDMNDPRRFALTDAVFIPGLFTFSDPGKVGDDDGVEIWHNDSYVKVANDGTVKLGTGSTVKEVSRKGDATTADPTTDPTNFPMVVAVCGMFGMTVTKLDGKITAGSAKVKASD